MADAYPLSWPLGWPRTERREKSKFGTPFAKARDDLINEIRLLGGRNLVISSNIALRRDGLPYANQSEPVDTGIAVYFELDGEQQCFPCDKWTTTTDNLYAICLSINALRGLARWGSKDMVKASFQGFKALPSPAGHKDYFAGCYTREDLKERYRELAQKLHPDKGGTDLEFAEMSEQFNKLLKEKSEAKP